MPGAKRNAYTSDFKLRVVAAAEDTSNRAAAREFNVGESSIREWRQMKNELLEINPRKRACRGPTSKWPQLENELKRWILSRREKTSQFQQLRSKFKQGFWPTRTMLWILPQAFRGSPNS